MNNHPLHKELREFILSVIRQREFLIKNNRSHGNTTLMMNIIQELKLYLDTYPYNSDEKISKFFLRNKAKIRLLLPGEGSSCQSSREQQYYAYLSRTEEQLYSFS